MERGMRRSSRFQAAVLACLFVLSLPCVTLRIYASDEVQYYAFLRSIWFDRDLSFENEYQYFYDRGVGRSVGFYETHLQRQTPTGLRINFGTVGCAILWAPFYAIGDLVAHISSWLGGNTTVDGYSKPYIAAVCYASAFYGFLALLFSIRIVRYFGLNPLPAAVTIWFGTPLLFYMYVAPVMAHACSAFVVALMLYVWLRARGTWTVASMAGLGAVIALMAMVREQDAFLAIGPALDFAVWAGAFIFQYGRRGIGAIATRTGVAGATFVLTYLPQAITYVRLNGHLGPSQLVTRKFSWTSPHALSVLFSPDHGFFIWTPMAFLAVVGLVYLLIHARGSSSTQPAIARSPGSMSTAIRFSQAIGGRAGAVALLLLTALLQVYSAGGVESWTTAGAFGQRRFVALTAILVLGIAALNRRVSGTRMRIAVTTAMVLAVYWNLALMAEFGTGLMDRQRLELRRNAYDAFVTIPRMAPELAYRYLFHRASFYRTPAPQ
jgi:hypothetical protein